MSMVIGPFTNDDRLLSWEAANCARCRRAWTVEGGYACPIQLALHCSVPGPISLEIAVHMGFATATGYRTRDGVWPCSEARRGGFLDPAASLQSVEVMP